MSEGIGGILDAAQQAIGNILQFFANPLDASIEIQLEAEKTIEVHNTITLDGAVIKRYISEVLARETAKSAKARGFNSTLVT